MVETVGRSIESLIPQAPDSARHMFEASYGWVALSGALKRQKTYAAAMDRFNGKIAQTIAKAMAHPGDTAVVNLFMPCQLITAMHLTPLFPEVLSAYVANTACAGVFGEAAEANNVPETLCSYHKVLIGVSQTGVLGRPACIVNTTVACDANQVTFRELAQLYQVPHFVVDVPHHPNERSVAQVEAQFYDLIAWLEHVTGRAFDTAAFMESMALSKKTLDIMAEYRALRGGVTLPTTSTGELLEMLATHLLLGTQASYDLACDLLELAQNAPAAETSDKPRIFWMHIMPNWQKSMRALFDGAGSSCELVGCDMTFDTVQPFDPGHPVRTLAERITYTHFNGKGSRRIEDTLRDAKAANADGIVVFCHWGCKTTLGLSQLAKQRFEEEGFPTLVLDGDGCDPRNVADSQMVTRVNAFAEQLAGLRAAKNAAARAARETVSANGTAAPKTAAREAEHAQAEAPKDPAASEASVQGGAR